MSNFCQLWLTCETEAEATKIAKSLLDQKLIACAKKVPVSATYHWKGAIEQGDETLLVMEGREDLFDQIETEVAKLHSYETFVLQAIPMTKVSKRALGWLHDSLKEA